MRESTPKTPRQTYHTQLASQLFTFNAELPNRLDDVVLLRACLDAAQTQTLEYWAQSLSLPHALSRPRLKTLLMRSSLKGANAYLHLSAQEQMRVQSRLPSLKEILNSQRKQNEENTKYQTRTRIQKRLYRAQEDAQTQARALKSTDLPPSFVAIDFETATAKRQSACALAAIRVEAGKVTARLESLIRPSPLFVEPRNSQIHGLRAEDLQDAPRFSALWPRLQTFFSGADFIIAHNVGFDRSVLEACCRQAHLPIPSLAYRCTVNMARQTFDLPAYKLNVVAAHLAIPLQHHDAGSDAEACARIALEIWQRNPAAFELSDASKKRE